MSVFSRFSDIINSNINAILDQAEDPEKMVRMITQEMEETLVEVRTASARYIADQKQIERNIKRHREQASQWEAKAELAISKGRDDLARSALVEKAAHEEAVASAETEISALDGAIEKLKSDTRQLEEKLKGARARQKSLVVRGKTTQHRIRIKKQFVDSSLDDAFEKFERYERRVDHLEGELESMDLGSHTLADEIEDLARNEEIDAQLQALKARMGGTSQSGQTAQ